MKSGYSNKRLLLKTKCVCLILEDRLENNEIPSDSFNLSQYVFNGLRDYNEGVFFVNYQRALNVLDVSNKYRRDVGCCYNE